MHRKKEFLLEPNEFTITRPWEAHKVGNPDIGMKFYWVILDLNVRRPHQQWEWQIGSYLIQKTYSINQNHSSNEKAVWKGNKQLRSCFKIAQVVDSDIAGSNSSKIRLLINQLLLIPRYCGS